VNVNKDVRVIMLGTQSRQTAPTLRYPLILTHTLSSTTDDSPGL